MIYLFLAGLGALILWESREIQKRLDRIAELIAERR
jgi:hypothetical protein